MRFLQLDGTHLGHPTSGPCQTDDIIDALTRVVHQVTDANTWVPAALSGSRDPQNEDSDDDSLGDAFEANADGSACSVSDADGDGFDDGEELNLGADRRDPTAFLAAPGVTVGFSAARQD